MNQKYNLKAVRRRVGEVIRRRNAIWKTTCLTVTVGTLATVTLLAPPAQAAPPSPKSDAVFLVNNHGDKVEVPAGHLMDTKVKPSKTGSGNLADLEGGIQVSSLDLTKPRIDLTEPKKDKARSSSSDDKSHDDSMVSPMVIIGGVDNRTKVSNVYASPYSQTALILFTNGGKDYMCSGGLVGNRTLVTAGHCLFATEGVQEWSTEVSVLFSVEGTTYNVGCYPSSLNSSSPWVSGQSQAYDWGVIQLACNAGDVIGHYGYRDSGNGSVANTWNITGYPGDKVTSSGYYMYTHAGTLNYHNTLQFSYTIDTTGGQSGAPIWRLESGTACGNCVIGVHSAGSSGAQLNFGTRLTAAFKASVDGLVAQ